MGLDTYYQLGIYFLCSEANEEPSARTHIAREKVITVQVCEQFDASTVTKNVRSTKYHWIQSVVLTRIQMQTHISIPCAAESIARKNPSKNWNS